MAKQRKVVNVLSKAALAGMVASAMLTSQAFAAVDAYTVKVGENVYEYSKSELVQSFLDNSEGLEAPLYEDFSAKLAEGKGVHSYHDDKNGYVSFASVSDAFMNAEGAFDMNAFTESEDAGVVEVPTVKKAVVKDGEVAYNEEGQETETGDLVVKEVEALNAAQIKVTFNKVLTGDAKDEATDEENYTVEDADEDEIDDLIKSADLEEDGKTVILTVDHSKVGDDDGDYENQAKYKLKVDENVTGTETTKDFEVKDFNMPEVESVDVVGIKTIKLKLTEPVVAEKNEELKDAFEVNDGDYSIEEVKSINNGKELNIVLYSELKDGEDLTVDIKSGAEDFAGYSLKKDTFKTKVNINKDALKIVEYKKAKDDEITLVFNKDVRFHEFEDETKIAMDKNDVKKKYDSEDGFEYVDEDDDVIKGFYHSSAKNKAEAIEIDGNEVTLHFGTDYLLPETAYVFVESDVLEDLWEKTNDDLNIKAEITKDQVRPEVKKIEQDADLTDPNKKVVITFTEDLDRESAEKEENYKVTDPDGKNIRVSHADLTDDDEVTLTLAKELEDGTKYELKIEDVEDKAENNIKDYTTKFTAHENESINEVTARFYNPSESDQKIVVDFDTEMLSDKSRYAINNLENYDLSISDENDKLIKKINLSDYDDASVKAVEDAHKAEIKLPGNKADNDDRFDFKGKKLKLSISKLEDVNENRTSVIDTDVAGKTTVGLDDDNPSATDLETIKIVLEDKIDFEKADIVLKYGNKVDNKFVAASDSAIITPASKRVDNENGKTTITYTLDEDDQLLFNGNIKKGDEEYVVAVTTIETPKSENNYGDTLEGSQAWIVEDEINPALAILKEDSNDNSTTTVAMGIELDDRDDYEDAVMVTDFHKDGNTRTAAVVLKFEEAMSSANINNLTFDTDDSDVDVVAAKLLDSKTVILKLDATSADEDDFDSIDDFVSLSIRTGSNEVFDEEGNGTTIDTEVELKNEDNAAWKLTTVFDK
ncbi:Ig-like domain-containing protein [Clostridium aestuarii]|uniref:Ig-like domain-containing protein n=1 Tax=Clostridium aestuarii TaxID=338193 RepID=A0ABT4CZU0_9CLOT|nr:Ig-like domain-containing protein [Clostridium aestuarii]MCY6484500.1 Ig-like domain-containing protein [Clostridium aestuarii]